MAYDLSRYDDFQSFVDIHPIVTDEIGFTPSKLSEAQSQVAGRIRVFLRGAGGASTIYEIATALELEQSLVGTLLIKMSDIAIVGKCKNSRKGGDKQNVYGLLDIPVSLPEKKRRVKSAEELVRRNEKQRAKYEKRKNTPEYKESKRLQYLRRKEKGKPNIEH